MFKPVSPRSNFPQLEEQILTFWDNQHIFQKSIEARQGSPRFVLYEGPPTANGNPGIHHVLARVFKDIIARYKTMAGYYAPRKAGWDTHGLPVELEVERTLGFSTKAQIEEYGVDRFNKLCRDSIFHYLKEWEAITRRIGFWVDLEHPYISLDNGYIESCWWIIKQLWSNKLIYEGHRVTPHCPRCGTSLSSHEVSLGYHDNVEDPSVFIKFKVAGLMSGHLERLGVHHELPTYLLAWTTTPWTLPGNTALAVAPDDDYCLVEILSGDNHKEGLILAEALLKSALVDDYHIISTFKGSEIIDLHYKPLYNPHLYDVDVWKFGSHGGELEEVSRGDIDTYPVIGEDFVAMDEGTGIVHIAPAFGELDYISGRSRQLYFVQPVDLRGNTVGQFPFSGKFVKEADPFILEELKSRGLLYRSEKIHHTYPFCWRCDSPLLYYAKKTWYVRTTAVKGKLLSGNSEINWYPDYIKYGRFGDWLENNVDWAFSRERYWGTPLPVWLCQSCGQYECAGSLEELKTKANLVDLVEPVDLHRPFVDRITYACPNCSGTMQRVPEVIDCWFDSGAMPLAQWHYPFENQDEFEHNFPADFICEAVDQTRGWFYSLHALSTLLFNRPCFHNVICLGHILDAAGEKMSKAKGNVVDPWVPLQKYGADALRWYFFVSSPLGSVRRFSTDGVTEVQRKFLMTLWNTYSFFVLYANIDRFDPMHIPEVKYTSDLDKWVLSELNQLVMEVTVSLNGYDPTRAAREIEGFVDNLSNWYIRRSRRRFWKSENDADKLAAHATLYQCLLTMAKLIAPFTPFIAEEMYQNLVFSVDSKAVESVHLTDFPLADETKIDTELMASTRIVMKVSSLGRAARSKAGIKVRQPLATALVKVKSESERRALQQLSSQVLDELNVKKLEFSEEPELSDPEKYAMASEGSYWVAVATEISPELAAEGMAREIVHRLQTMRRAAGFDIADYIITYYQGDPPIEQVMQQFTDYVKQETLSQELIPGTDAEEVYTQSQRIQGHQLVLAVKKL